MIRWARVPLRMEGRPAAHVPESLEPQKQRKPGARCSCLAARTPNGAGRLAACPPSSRADRVSFSALVADGWTGQHASCRFAPTASLRCAQADANTVCPGAAMTPMHCLSFGRFHRASASDEFFQRLRRIAARCGGFEFVDNAAMPSVHWTRRAHVADSSLDRVYDSDRAGHEIEEDTHAHHKRARKTQQKQRDEQRTTSAQPASDRVGSGSTTRWTARSPRMGDRWRAGQSTTDEPNQRHAHTTRGP